MFKRKSIYDEKENPYRFLQITPRQSSAVEEFEFEKKVAEQRKKIEAKEEKKRVLRAAMFPFQQQKRAAIMAGKRNEAMRQNIPKGIGFFVKAISPFKSQRTRRR